jgi:adenylate cyclase
MGTLFLQEVDASVLVADVRDFSPLSQQLGPVDLGLALGRFYEHVSSFIEGHHGRIVKFMGDGVLGVFIGGDHRLHVLEAVAEAIATRQTFLDENVGRRLPVLDYCIGVASGAVLAGELGTDKLRFYDVLGQPVNQAFRITALATRRAVSNLVDAGTWEGVKTQGRRPPAIETDAVELANEKVRLFKLEG